MTTAAELEKTDRPAKVDTEFFVRPRYSARHLDDAYEVRVEMPGTNRESVDVNLEKELVTITGTVVKTVPESWKVLHRETSGHNYRLQLQLHFDLDADGVTAKVDDGVLHLRLPMSEAAKPRMISVE